jgi:hypothetical protein
MRLALALLALGLLGVGPIRCGDDPMPRLEAEKRALLAATVPKAQFWDAVGKKGELLKQEKEVEAEAAPFDEKRAALEAEAAAAQADVVAARAERERAQAALDGARAALERARAEQAAREARLRSFAERHAAGAS